MGEDDRFPWWHRNYRPAPRNVRTMKQVKADFNKNLQKHTLSKTRAK
jgi:hypothetical protein